ncbi:MULTISPECIES: class C sortase [Corynebacterium]|uniref:class C sortase n=1 Tax=Corynebacterium TaxID=1716 RepID=UPI001EF17493|nr:MULTISPECIES: class C sortase [Corynebacterium]MCG7228840.1 class C sortase [Corynebacterium minutissimum]MCG7237957.1 class C sortase [Corynebacterium minutissimum]MDK8762652.1 class C sortase [Corynebacterium sp. MSK218]
MTKRKNKRRSFWLIVAGILILLYPIVATQYNDYHLYQQAESYGRSVRDIDPPTQRQHYLHAAHDYNDWLAQQGHHAYPPTPDSPGFERYLDTLNAPETGGVIARLRIPSIGVDLPVFHTTAPNVLYSGAGHMFGSSLPVGGPGTNAVISAHTGMVNASMFDNLPRLRDGETVTVDVMGETLTYKVTGREVVKPEDYEAVTYEAGKDKLTLITCTPYGINTDRLLVHAERVPTQVEEESGWQPKLSWWMILALILISTVLVIVWWNERRRGKSRRQRVD